MKPHENGASLQGYEERGETMKYFLADYLTYDGEHEYSEHGVLTARTFESAKNKATKGRKFFTRYGWEEFCELFRVDEIPMTDYRPYARGPLRMFDRGGNIGQFAGKSLMLD
jgi:hypothetical protein